MRAWEYTQYFAGTMSNDNIGSNSVHHINRVCSARLPWTSHKSVGLGCQSTNGAEVNDVTT